MSNDATRWAWIAPVETSTQKLVLLSLADRAGEHHTAWPSIDRLAKDTVLDKKTVQKVILELIKLNLISDTGERVGSTRRVRVLKLNGVKGREEISYLDNDSASKNNKLNPNTAKNGNIKPSQNRNNSESGNNPNNSTLNDPENGIQNLSPNLPFNLSQEHEWIPDPNNLINILKTAGQQANLELIFGLPDFEFQLGAFNSYYSDQVMPDSRKLYNFARWIIDKFQRYKKVNPDYGSPVPSQENKLSVLGEIQLPTKPKGLLGAVK